MIKRLLRDPLAHFLGVGLLLFGLHALVAPSDTGGEKIVMSRAVVDDLSAQYAKLWGRPPGKAELDSLIDARVRDEIMYREGKAMGLDRDDAVIKRRVQQKYELIAEEEDSVAPTEAELQAYLKENPNIFRVPPVVSFTQVMVSDTASEAETASRTASIRKALEGGADPAQAGKATLLPGTVNSRGLDLVARDFGDRFAGALATIPVGQWAGPILSAYGVHLVRLDQRIEAEEPGLDTIRADVQREWENERRLEARDARLEALRKRYEVVIDH